MSKNKMSNSVLNNRRLVRIYNKILSKNYIDKYIFGLVNFDNSIIERYIKIVFKDLLATLEIEKPDESIVDYIFDNFNCDRDSDENIRKIFFIKAPRRIDVETSFLSKTLSVHAVLVMRDLIDILVHTKSNEHKLDMNLSKVRDIEKNIIICRDLLKANLKRKRNSKKGGESKTKLKGIEHAILDRLKDRPNATPGQLWQYFEKFHGAPDPNDPEGKEKYKEVDDYKIYVADGLIYEIKHMKKGKRHKNIAMYDGITKSQFEIDYVKNVKKMMKG